jgi:peptide/nickel transport system substrate-binding protein
MTGLFRGNRRWLPTFIAIAALLSAWGAPVGRAAPARALPTINIGIVSDISTLDPAISSSFYDRQLLNNLTDKLFDLDTKGNIVPMLATGYKVSKDGLTYTIALRKGVKFQDGTPFNADAVKFNLDRYRQPTSAPRAAELKPVDSVTAAGTYSVKIHLTSPFSPLISILTDRSGMMMSPKAIQDEGTNFPLQPVGTGPFKLQERVKGDHITLVRNTSYWRKGFPKAAQIVFHILTDPNAQLVNLLSGQMDFVDSISSQNVAAVQQDKALKLVDRAGFGWGGFWLNTKDPALSSPLVRRAISLLIDRKQYITVVANKVQIPANSPFGPGDLAYGPVDKAPKPDVKAARKLLANAHATNVTFTFDTTTDPVAGEAAQVLQNMLKAGGITMNINPESFPTILTQLGQHNFQAAAVGWSGRPDPDQNAYNHFVTGGPNNFGQYSSPAADKYLNMGRNQTDPKKRKLAYTKLAEQLQKDAPYIFLDHPNNSFGVKAALKGFTYVPDGIIRTVGMTK